MNEQMINYRFVGVKGDTNDDLMTAIARNKMHKVGQICNVKYCASNEWLWTCIYIYIHTYLYRHNHEDWLSCIVTTIPSCCCCCQNQYHEIVIHHHPSTSNHNPSTSNHPSPITDHPSGYSIIIALPDRMPRCPTASGDVATGARSIALETKKATPGWVW